MTSTLYIIQTLGFTGWRDWTEHDYLEAARRAVDDYKATDQTAVLRIVRRTVTTEEEVVQ